MFYLLYSGLKKLDSMQSNSVLDFTLIALENLKEKSISIIPDLLRNLLDYFSSKKSDLIQKEKIVTIYYLSVKNLN